MNEQKERVRYLPTYLPTYLLTYLPWQSDKLFCYELGNNKRFKIVEWRVFSLRPMQNTVFHAIKTDPGIFNAYLAQRFSQKNCLKLLTLCIIDKSHSQMSLDQNSQQLCWSSMVTKSDNQCDQLARLIVHYWAIQSNENLPNSKKLSKWVHNFAKQRLLLKYTTSSR